MAGWLVHRELSQQLENIETSVFHWKIHHIVLLQIKKNIYIYIYRRIVFYERWMFQFYESAFFAVKPLKTDCTIVIKTIIIL